MKILMVSNYFPSHGGGIEIVAGNLSQALRSRGCSVTLCAYDSGRTSESDKDCLPLCGTNFVEKRSGIPYPLLYPKSVAALRAQVRASDIVHVHDCIYESSRVAGYTARALNKPLVVTQHIGGLPFKDLPKRLLFRAATECLTKPLLKRASPVVFISENVQRHFAACFDVGSAPITIFNGLDAALFRMTETRAQARHKLGLPHDRPIALFVGRFIEKKGLERIHLLARNFPETQWCLIGRGPLDPRTWALPNVLVVGQIPHAEVPTWFRAADLFVLLSVGEGFPLVVQEALACGCPVVVSPEIETACPALVGRVITTRDDFSDSIVRFKEVLALLPESDRSRADRSAAFEQEWSWGSCAAQYHKLYSKLLAAKSF